MFGLGTVRYSYKGQINMNNEKGVTLIELLISIVIAGMVIVPLLLIMTGSFTRTIHQGKDTQLIYFGQQVMETIREKGYQPGVSPVKYYCVETKGCLAEGNEDPSIIYEVTAEIVNLDANSIPNKILTYSSIEFYEITVHLKSKNKTLELVTVVRK